MKASSSPAAATALAALYAKDGRFVERSLGHLTPAALNELDRRLLLEFFSSSSDAAAAAANNEEDWEGGSSLLLSISKKCPPQYVVQN